MSEDMKSTLIADTLLRAIQDVLSDVAEKIHGLPEACKSCPVYNALSDFAVKLRRAGLQEEAEIVRAVRERYGI